MKESESAPVDLCLEVLRRLDGAGVLEDLVLVGSWCTHFYNRYFEGKAKLSALRTRDMDFLVHRPPRFKNKVLVAERGKNAEATIPVPALGIRAQPLRFLDFLSRDTIVLNHDGLEIRLPHPASFALHKLIVSGRRAKPEKADKDLRQGLEILDVLSGLGRSSDIKARFEDMPAGWRKMVLQALRSAGRADLEAALKP